MEIVGNSEQEKGLINDKDFTILMRSVYGLTNEEENKQVDEIIKNSMERLVLQNLQEEKLQYNSYENHLEALEQKTESMLGEFQKQLTESRENAMLKQHRNETESDN